ncbi:C40 family peptidase [Streptomyces sp. P9(2023)]|uniref:C40 family peptidase n=1 Tax=Streptomyces sp. P9(2023) TaxID=3064394 RepID=UPI0028F41E6D|nr:C40 family peptidase [Streptomyces sp. P9(2023)]MDT9688710.1 C40 family peptidase [Streptomyces sp. P9(2023)]
MAAHRKPKHSPLGGQAARTAATLALASAATATVFEGSGHTEPRLTPAQVKAKVDRLYQEAEVATEKYNGAKEKADAARDALDRLQDESARRTDRLNTARNGLGSIATAQYRSGGLDPAVRLALTSDPDQYLARAALVEKAGQRQASTIASVRRELTGIRQLRAESDRRLTELRGHEADLRQQKAAVQGKLTEARSLLARLTAEERARYEAAAAGSGRSGGSGSGTDTGTGTGSGTGSAGARADRDSGRGGPVTAPNGRAAQAISFARDQIGKPYVWGATGPSAYDCSGLTQAAWRAAGVALPRTTYTQINAGQRVSRSQLAPGDLVFFYSGISHVGLYIGGGQMIHAPRPGAPVRVAPIDEMPFAGATRVG